MLNSYSNLCLVSVLPSRNGSPLSGFNSKLIDLFILVHLACKVQISKKTTLNSAAATLSSQLSRSLVLIAISDIMMSNAPEGRALRDSGKKDFGVIGKFKSQHKGQAMAQQSNQAHLSCTKLGKWRNRKRMRCLLL